VFEGRQSGNNDPTRAWLDEAAVNAGNWDLMNIDFSGCIFPAPIDLTRREAERREIQHRTVLGPVPIPSFRPLRLLPLPRPRGSRPQLKASNTCVVYPTMGSSVALPSTSRLCQILLQKSVSERYEVNGRNPARVLVCRALRMERRLGAISTDARTLTQYTPRPVAAVWRQIFQGGAGSERQPPE
jgi:hypothetical protein